MLTHLLLENIAVFERLTLPVAGGLTMIVGEAGSGKSLLLDGLDWALGAAVSAKDILRSGTEQGRVEVTFDLANPSRVLLDWLAQQGVDLADCQLDGGGVSIVLSRSFQANGTSRSRVNGVLVPRTAIETIREELVALQSQHAAVALSAPAQQRLWLDRFGGEPLQVQLEEVRAGFQQWQALCAQLADSEANLLAHQAEWERLTTIDQELADGGLKGPDEDEVLHQELDRLTHGEQLMQHYSDALSIMRGGDGWNRGGGNVIDTLDKLRKRLTQAAARDPVATPAADTATALVEELRELSHTIQGLRDGLDLRPQQLQNLMERLEVLEKLKRRYGPTLAEVLAYQNEVANALIAMTASPEKLVQLRQQVEAARRDLAAAMDRLTALRQEAALAFEAGISPLLVQLELPNARLIAELTPQTWTTHGADAIALLFSANPGEPPKPLGKVASGGELSRILLALKVLEAQRGQATGRQHQLMIFDEIDTGTSGQVARAIAQQLTVLARAGHQVLVITHQPIVAAAGQRLWRVEKLIRSESGALSRAHSQVEVASDHGQRRALVAWLASGSASEHHAATGQFAELLLSQANKATDPQRGKATDRAQVNLPFQS